MFRSTAPFIKSPSPLTSLSARASASARRYRSRQTILSDSTKPVPWWERIQLFPQNVWQLYHDCWRVKDIYDASHTPRNTWTNHYKIMGRIPRRQQEQVRQVQEDISIVLPLVILWIPPIIGYLPMFLAVATPRQVLSRQFWNLYEREAYAILELQQRQAFYEVVSDHVWTSLLVHHHTVDLPLLGHDAAGPLWKLQQLFHEFCHTPLVHCEVQEHVMHLALATGHGQRFPPPLPQWMVQWWSPKWLLTRQIRLLAHQVWLDDKLLLEEGYHLQHCQALTDDEVREACRLRGLPVLLDYDEMRRCMTHHLEMVQDLWLSVPSDTPRLHLQLFVLHLAPLRYCAAQQQQQSPTQEKKKDGGTEA
jgi:hypothetical protein